VIDLHCHILPGFDDGAVTLADSLNMGKQADADGIELVCATPHIRQDHPVRIGDFAGAVDQLNDEFAQDDIGVRLAVGSELAETMAGSLTEDELDQITLGGGGRWLLIEPAPGALSDTLVDTVRWLGRLGFRSVIAHPERHYHAGAPELLARMVEEGALVQVTAADVTHRGNITLELAQHGLVHVLGTDSHSARVGRPVRLSEAFESLAGIDALSPHFNWIAYDAPRAIVKGEEVEPPFGCRQAARGTPAA
jgi:protein-tyrosine phosphatase